MYPVPALLIVKAVIAPLAIVGTITQPEPFPPVTVT